MTVTGLSSVEAGRRLAEYGANELAEPPPEPLWRKVLRPFRNLLVVVLLIAAMVSLVVSREWETPVAITLVVLLNAVIGFVQESRAGAALDALRRLNRTVATVRRDGETVRVDATVLVPGDVVLVEAGDRVPADGRLLEAVSLEVRESMLTGESEPVAKTAGSDVVFSNTEVTRGRAVIEVTSTGMDTEVGRIAHLLHTATAGPTPLQRQIDGLSRTLAIIAAAVIGLVFVLGLVRGQPFGDLFVSAVSLAVAAIPEGLPAVVAFTLAMGTARLARQGAVVKRLASVETLGGTSQICTDKTGTLTLNQMTARELHLGDSRYLITGEGYSTDGGIGTAGGTPPPEALTDALQVMALCSEAVLHDGEVVGDPTEGALVVLAAKGGVDVTALRAGRPRLLEVPFDSGSKFMATFHRWPGDRVRCLVKGAPDVLGRRADRYHDGTAEVALDDAARARFEKVNAELAGQGMRVLAVAVRDFPVYGFGPADPAAMVDGLVLLALIGIVDPPREQARQAVAECRAAGIRVRMLTGDHVVTAQAIATELGIPGTAVTGADLDAITGDAELAARLDDVGVVARVSPDHKIRIVRALQSRGDVVAMTGDGVNDAPALRKADIGVAMGVTGTEVSKEAATMVLTDDNFATIVAAVREGRGVYANIVSFTRFQVSTSLGFVMIFLFASLTGLAGGTPFTALQILFVNLVMDGPPAMSLGVDPVGGDAMRRPPRHPRERIMSGSRLARILLSSAVMAAGTLAVLAWAPASAAATMGFVTFVFFQAFNLFNVRHDTLGVFRRETLANRWVPAAVAAVVALLVVLVQWDPAHALFATTDLTVAQWALCAAAGSTVLVVGELVKLAARRGAVTAAAPGEQRVDRHVHTG